MKRKLITSAMLLIFLGCKSSPDVDLSDPISSARGFIEATLKGDYVKAEAYMLTDSTNKQYLAGLRDFSKGLDAGERENYREADIIIDSTKSLNDSTDIIYYKNTFKKEPTRLKLLKRGEDWKVDFKYTFVEE